MHAIVSEEELRNNISGEKNELNQLLDLPLYIFPLKNLVTI